MATKKEFSEEQIKQITEMRDERYSYENIAFMMGVSKSRVKKFCVDILGEIQTTKIRDYVPEVEPCSVPLPKFSNPACRGHNPKMWFTVLPANASSLQRKEAKINGDLALKICSNCDNQLECLEYGVKAEPYGIWGGTNEAERMYIRKKLNIECAREGGFGHSLRGISRPVMQMMCRDPKHVEHLFTNPIITKFILMSK